MAVLDVTPKSSSDCDLNNISNLDNESEDRTENQVERLARSGLYINPSDAIKFLSDQVCSTYILFVQKIDNKKSHLSKSLKV
jgi:hypothetical protein